MSPLYIYGNRAETVPPVYPKIASALPHTSGGAVILTLSLLSVTGLLRALWTAYVTAQTTAVGSWHLRIVRKGHVTCKELCKTVRELLVVFPSFSSSL
jgi:hypothetical protein